MDETIKLVDECFDSLRYDLGGDQSRGMAEIDTQKLRTFILHYMNVANGKYSQQLAPVSATEQADKALRFDLDCAGIEQREAEAIELVSLRARLAEAERVTARYEWLKSKLRVRIEQTARPDMKRPFLQFSGLTPALPNHLTNSSSVDEAIDAALTAARGGG